MADIKTMEARSKNMAAIKGKDTKPEIYLRKLLFSHGFRYRKNYSKLPGHPDIWLKKYNTAIFVHGCFWHRHNNCKHAYTPKSRQEYWLSKFEANKNRDQIVCGQLYDLKIKTLIVWECTIKLCFKSAEKEEQLINRIYDFFESQLQYMEL